MPTPTETAKDACDYLFRIGKHKDANVEFDPVGYLRLRIDEAVKAEREACAALISTGEFCRHVEHVQGFCDCADMAAAIRART